jgi:hypothetical protein
MKNVDYLSSAGLRVLLIYYKKLKELKGALHLSELQDRVMKIVEMAGLYGLLAPLQEEKNSQDKSPLRSVSYPGWSLEEYELEKDTVLTCRFIGHTCQEISQDNTLLPLEVLPFPPSTLSVGIGALGNDETECRQNLGVFMTAGGMAACKPNGIDCPPDYVAYAEAYIPHLYVASALSMTGGFSHLASFACKDFTAIGFIDLAQYMIAAVESPMIGFLIEAECEMNKSESYYGTGTDKSSIICACGLAGSGHGREMKNWLSPWDATAAVSGHIHGAFFPYQPLRLGHVRLKETIAHLFEQELLDIAHMEPLQDANGHDSIRLKRGLVWFAKID